ncbi:MAG: hypothetical protein LBU65_12260 [Planctomycetaceae bacterium]|jgi:hypothetical protein|nr:hypothetical protein [Planctomycetaceae bacterium]
MSRTRVIITLFFIFISNISFGENIPGIKDIESGIENRILTYDGLEFALKSNLQTKDENIKNVQEVFRLHFPPQGPSWKYWTQKIEDKYDKEWILNRFLATNMKESRSFKYSPEAEGNWSEGSIYSWYIWDEEQGRIFSTFLGINTIGISLLAFDVSTEIKNEILDKIKLKFDREATCDGVKVYIFGGYDESREIKYELHTTGYPHFLTTRYGTSSTKEDFSIIYDVQKIGVFDGICYPQKGSFHQTSKKNVIGKVDYDFEVNEVCRFESELLKNWFPEWPPSTIVANANTDKSITIPPSERQLKKVAEEWERQVEQSKYPFLGVLRVIFFVAGTILILVALFRMIRKRYKKS